MKICRAGKGAACPTVTGRQEEAVQESKCSPSPRLPEHHRNHGLSPYWPRRRNLTGNSSAVGALQGISETDPTFVPGLGSHLRVQEERTLPCCQSYLEWPSCLWIRKQKQTKKCSLFATSEGSVPRNCAPEQEKPLQWEVYTQQWRAIPTHRNQRKPAHSNEDPVHPKIK